MTEQMTSDNYIKNVLRTDCEYDVELYERLLNCARMLHAAMGLVTEAGELMDMLKKHIYYNKPFDKVNAKEETGDALWYIGLAIDEMSTTMTEVLTQNIAKLKLRYPDKFNSKDAIERDVIAERELLEGGYEDVSDKEYCNTNNLKPFEGVLSKRGSDWLTFQAQVLSHIETYTVPQYGDKPDDQLSGWTIEHCLEEVKKYANRVYKVTPDRQMRDFLKMAHYIQAAHIKYCDKLSAEAEQEKRDMLNG
jgi:NTP pyrophosphatase (non-canonical NTP hydrolase)